MTNPRTYPILDSFDAQKAIGTITFFNPEHAALIADGAFKLAAAYTIRNGIAYLESVSIVPSHCADDFTRVSDYKKFADIDAATDESKP